MPEEMESPTEKLEEHIHEAAEHAKEDWLRWCALMSAVFAVMAALSGLVSSGYANTAMIEQIKASDQWGYYQAKGVKALIVENSAKPDATKLQRYKQEEESIHEAAQKLTESSEKHMEQHEITARAVTCFQVSIALIAIVVLTKRRRFLFLSAGLGIAGFVFLAMGV